MTPINIVALTTTAVYLMLGGIIYIHSRRNISENFFALMSLSLTTWGIATFLIVSPSLSGTFFQIGAYAHYIAGNLVFLCLFWFALYFPERNIKSLAIPILITLVDGAFFIAIIATDFFFSSFAIFSPLEKQISFHTGNYILYTLYILFLFVTAEVILLKKYKTRVDANKTPILYMFLGTTIASTPALFSNLILPGLGYFSLFSIGPIFGIVFIVTIAYAIFKHNLLNVKIIATEFFVSLIILILIIEVLSASSISEFLLKTVTLAAVSLLGYLIIRSVLKEVEIRQQIEQLAGELKTANKELGRISQAKSDFISMASHQLKTPLSIIKGYISMTLEGSFGNLSKKITDQLQKVYISNERLIALVDDLLNLSRVEEGRMKYDFSEEHIADIVQQIVDEVQMPAQRKKLRLIWERPAEKLYARVDLNKMRNVIFNLVDNAIKYTDVGAVTITVLQHDQSLHIAVSDTGRGISSQQIKKLFTKFTRVLEGSGRLTTSGFGLGLYVARLIVEEHKGRIWAESAGLGKGSTFVLELPIVEHTKK